MAPGCTSEKGKHRSGVCRTCHSGICHDCCKCRSSIRGRPRKQDIQPVASPMAVPIRDQPHRSCATKTNAISVEGLSEEIHESPLSSHSREHIFNILHLLDVSAENDVLHLPSVEQRQSATVKEDFVTSDGFRRVQSLFWKGVKGWIKILLPSWSTSRQSPQRSISATKWPFRRHACG